ncbi:MAG: winged helix DNA-binding protein [Alphaproteobacteria bacterium]|nr:winged helix DNA-binding protein [Alphaproteobacteria bacterium]
MVFAKQENDNSPSEADGSEQSTVDKNQLIFRINRVVRSIEATSGLDELDISARAILSFIGEAEAEQRTLNVSDVVKGPGFGTAPTVYSRLAELEKAGWIKSTPDPRDGRAKQVLLTARARRIYSKMSSETQKLLSGQRA